MSRDRFLQIYWNLHLCDPTSPPAGRSGKVQPLLDLLCPKFASAFKPGEFVSVDEAMIAFKGRASFRQYVRGKPHPLGIKAFVLADSETGYLLGTRLYFGKETNIMTDPNLLQSTRIVLSLTEPLEGLRHHVVTDRFYTSPELAKALEQRGLPFTGTAQVNRRGMPLAMRSGSKLKRGEVRAYRAGKMMAMQWQDKRTITMLSTAESCNIIEVRTHRGQIKDKPSVVQVYNNNMMGVDKMDQLSTYYSFLRKSIKWWKKVLFWLLEASVVNSFITYSLRLRCLGQQPLGHQQFRRALVLSLVARRSHVPAPRRPGRHTDNSLERTRPVPHYSEEGERRRDCRVCSGAGKRRATTFYCMTCSDHPHLHPGRCFRVYHTQVNFRSHV